MNEQITSPSCPKEALNLAILVDSQQVEYHLTYLVRGTAEDTLNALLDAEADALCGAVLL